VGESSGRPEVPGLGRGVWAGASGITPTTGIPTGPKVERCDRATSARPIGHGMFPLLTGQVTVSRPVGGVLSVPEGTGWPSIYAAYLGTATLSGG
jgi:hypothetical protein